MMTNSSMRQLRRNREQAHRRSDVIAVASTVFAEKGFHDTQISVIAEECELSLASIYSLFEGKNEIYQEVLNTAVTSIRNSVQKEIESISDPAECLLTVIDSLFACFDENRALIQIYSRGTQGLPWHTRQVVGDQTMMTFRAFREWIESLAEDAKLSGHLHEIDAESFAASLIGAVTRTATHWIENHPDQSLSQAATTVRQIFARVLEPDEK